MPVKDTDFVVVTMNKNNKQIFEPFKINFVTGETTQLLENKDPKILLMIIFLIKTVILEDIPYW
jgi:hypothetical protein